ncbi:MAG: penicillin-binding transpeptidase domain-containing protein, partial [Cyclobacteriaceae bacterium]|nr:penicillin-binding transpeptidase domain-containing protein [Cyclobacteriaceae bacterium]
DNQDNQVLAYVGSADFHNALDGGQVDGVRGIRSPGSTLKPLLYALAFDKGKVTPKSMIGDVPVYFSGYEPENYDERFHGNVSVEYALSNSLNIPAVKLLNEIGVSSLVTSLRNSGFQQISRDANKLGLSTILGGCGVRLEELAGLYSAFANGGTYRSHKFFAEQDMEDSLEIITPGASYLLTEILTQVTRPDLPLQWHNAQNLPKVAWKTGTSYGRRDAWSVGYNQKFTVAVWVGNFSGEGVPDLTGADIAAPLFFQIFNAVDYQTPKDWYNIPESVGFRYVCSESGDNPNHFCDNQIMDYFLKNVSAVKKCQHLRPAWVDAQGGFSYCTSCLPEGGYKQEWYPNHSGPMLTYLQSHNIPYGEIPAHNPDCERVWVAGAPEITSPLHGTEYFVNESDSMQMLLSAHVQNDVKDIYWYIDNQFYKKAAYNEQVFFEPSQGKVKISCSDDKGRNTDIVVTVKKVGF